MEKFKAQLNEALLILSDIDVKRDNVEKMAAAKQKIRKVIADLDKPPVDAETNQKNGA